MAGQKNGTPWIQKSKGQPFVKGDPRASELAKKAAEARRAAKLPSDVKALIQSKLPSAVARLAELIDSDNETVALRASEVIIERNLGKVAQPLEIAGANGGPITVQSAQIIISQLTAEQLRVLETLPTPGSLTSGSVSSEAQPALPGNVAGADPAPSDG